MEAKIKKFFEGAGKVAVDQLPEGATVLITIDQTSYALKVTDEREVEVGKGSKGGEMEIKGTQEILNDLFSSSSKEEYCKKIISYKIKREAPKVKILMERTIESTKKFQQGYYHFLRKMYFLK